MWQDIKSVYAFSWRAALVLPLLFLIPAIVEFAQHVVELNSGMYHNAAGAKAAADDSGRLLSGFAKTLAILIPTYWFTRFMAFDDRVKAARIEQPAFGLWLVLFAFNAAMMAYSLFGLPLGPALGLTGKVGQLFGPVLNGFWALFGIDLTAWTVAWPLGNHAIGPLRSLKVMNGSFWRTLGYMAAGVLPLMALHYALGYLAITVTPDWLDWLVLALDALIVAWLACTMAGSGFIAAYRAAQRSNVTLFESQHDKGAA